MNAAAGEWTKGEPPRTGKHFLVWLAPEYRDTYNVMPVARRTKPPRLTYVEQAMIVWWDLVMEKWCSEDNEGGFDRYIVWWAEVQPPRP